jgi:ferrochelatase
LREFLSDPRVVEIPRIIWWPILNGIVLRTRPRASAERYAQVWMSDGAPLKVHTERQTRLVQGYLGERAKQLPIVADYAMRYGSPSIAEKIDELKRRHWSGPRSESESAAALRIAERVERPRKSA